MELHDLFAPRILNSFQRSELERLFGIVDVSISYGVSINVIGGMYFSPLVPIFCQLSF